jgi:hypothetical protein
MPVVEPDTKSAIGKHIEDAALKLDQFFLLHAVPPPDRQIGSSFIRSAGGEDLDASQSAARSRLPYRCPDV